ncbi:hypothetical protein BV25DRAFT_1858684 [Artomyces pyxidatus]|uniref:Uncharacterized protein n=1 Tax=Artomyces pyxidatus TaxID=48021 RepID=A0ACB8SX67_9AGAM|nr:hypothetical protein BV25DRAFT_1858684 [Artomyces pyxidatus]
MATRASTLPPGIEGDFTETSVGGNDSWLTYETTRWYTNAFIIQEGSPNKLLLGYKKRGFGAHLYNGFGGKVEAGESPAEAAARELKEECGIDAPLQHCGSLLFVTRGGPEWAFQIEIYRAEEYSGTLTETDEMRPEWFRYPNIADVTPSTDLAVTKENGESLPPIPYDTMWPDDVHWMPLLLAGRHFVGRADFELDNEGKYKMLRWWFGVPA